jgi:hypothetical protein
MRQGRGGWEPLCSFQSSGLGVGQEAGLRGSNYIVYSKPRELRRFLSKYNEVYCLPKFCSVRCLLQPRIFANEFLIRPTFYKINYIMFGKMPKKISLGRKAPSSGLLPSSHRVGGQSSGIGKNFPYFNVLFHL